MKSLFLAATLVSSLPLAALAVHPVAVDGKAKAMPSGPVMMQGSEITYHDAPELGPGAKVAVLRGDPSKKGSHYAVRLKVGDGFRIPAHWHPGEETLVVMQGTFALGLGDKFDEAKVKPLNAGAVAVLPAKVRHFAVAKGDTIVDAHGIGPFMTNWVDPKEDPAKKK